jgi:hypothetical protein
MIKLQEALPAELRDKIGRDFLKGKPGRTADTFNPKEEPIEENLPWEIELLANLKSWYNEPTKELSDYFYSIKDQLDELAKEYPFTKFQNDIPVYRGTRIRENVTGILQACISKVKDGEYTRRPIKAPRVARQFIYEIPIKTNYMANRKSQSWTEDVEVAVGFADLFIDHINESKIPCILRMSGYRKDLYLPWQISDAIHANTLAAAEQEIIRISDVHAECSHLIVSAKDIDYLIDHPDTINMYANQSKK